ncbi:hypothetical protein L873DRAFT_1799856 [Choiromyces venosus 120613-1]|uniref:Uncharacterized protein n=1 Tax=Choiromyces venosus 120613-1 TaxID=1336337 RepID=A0A3N4KDB0_9PEZI|nr:hypothetical protein L873DRAFT_1799856 [Choiromyces venosus 120613-1]
MRRATTNSGTYRGGTTAKANYMPSLLSSAAVSAQYVHDDRTHHEVGAHVMSLTPPPPPSM